MTYSIDYILDYKRLMFGVIADSRALIPAIINKDGWTIKAYVDSQVALVTLGTLVYKITTSNGNLCGFVGIQTGQGPVFIKFQQFRPNFTPFLSEIQQNINNFILSGNWQFDYL